MLTITTAASNRHLLTPTERRLAARLTATDTSRDSELATYSLRVSDIISEFCGVRGDGITPVTLRAEVLTETFRMTSGADRLELARRFVVVSAIMVDGETVDPAEYETEAGLGFVHRLSLDGYRIPWDAGITVVTYTAGFATIPQPLKDAAASMVRVMAARAARDPLLKREQVVDVGEQEFWVGSTEDAGIPADVRDTLGPYRTLAVG